MSYDATLIIPYSNRPQHLPTLFSWVGKLTPSIEVIFVESSDHPTPDVVLSCADLGIQYAHDLRLEDAFCKSKILNVGLELAATRLVMALDADLVPLGNTLVRHLNFAERYPDIVFAGHRLMYPHCEILGYPNDPISISELAPEDRPSSTRKHLVERIRFGVSPIFVRDWLRECGSWDERFVGWGVEDEEVLERYLRHTDSLFVRSPDFIYLHMHHEPGSGWGPETLTASNRDLYARLRKKGNDG